MEMDWKTNMAELGGAFLVSWLVLGEMGVGGNMLMAGLLLAVLMILPMAQGVGVGAFTDAISLLCMLFAAGLILLVTYLTGGTDYLKPLVKYIKNIIRNYVITM